MPRGHLPAFAKAKGSKDFEPRIARVDCEGNIGVRVESLRGVADAAFQDVKDGQQLIANVFMSPEERDAVGQ